MCGTARARFAQSFVVLLTATTVLAALPGCATLRRKGATAEAIAASRELSRQGVAAMEMGQWAQAEDLLQRALQASPDDSTTHRSMAEVLWHRAAYQEAVNEIHAALEHEPANASLQVRAGEMLLAIGNGEAALDCAERAIQLDPKLGTAWALRGRCHYQLNHVDQALADLHHALQYSENDADVLFDVATIYRQRGQAARCLTTLHQLLDTYPPGAEPQPALLLEGLSLLDLGRPQQASEVLATAAQQGPASVEVLYHLAQAYSAAGDLDRAGATAHQALALNAAHEPSRQLLGRLANQPGSNEIQRR
ncbi:MAG: tetratricopeptide repeat protein [Pirellulales bacterium]|nr:tetratricopeptide repeat protein [Pirellulales bacterium]